jgi:heterotetrameric sarcosine oxidase delta subunit
MLLIECPYCGARDETEFYCGGQSHIARPNTSVDDVSWGRYLFERTNPRGRHMERWHHTAGCRRWFNLVRNTVTHEIEYVYQMTDPPPATRGATSTGELFHD